MSGEAELNRRMDGSPRIENAPVRRAGWLATALALIAMAVFALGVASAATAQTQRSTAKTTRVATPHGRTAEAAAAPVKSYGSSNAPITMEVFSDYECPSCRSLFEQTLRPLINDYVATGKVYLVHRDFPLPMHKYGYEAARWLNASARVGEFQNVEAALYDNQNSWAADGNIEKYVAAAMPPATFRRVQTLMRGCEDVATASIKPARLVVDPPGGCPLDSYIDKDRAMGDAIPVRATPTYVITYKGQRLPAGSGIVTWPILKQFFDSLLSQ